MAEKRYDERDLAVIEASGQLRQDANEGIFFARELESVKAETYDIEYPELMGTQVIPVSSNAGSGAETITYHQYDKVGQFKIISNYSEDLPRADVSGKEFTSKVKGIGGSYGYSIQDIRAARHANKSLETMKAAAARQAYEQKVNDIAFYGDEEHGIVGLLTHPNIPTYTLPNDGVDENDNPSTKFIHKTPDQVLRDLNGMAKRPLVLTKNVEKPDTLLIDYDTYSDIATRPRSANSDTTILEYFLAKNPYVKNVMVVNEFEGAGTNGTNIIMMYKKDKRKITLEIPQPFEQLTVQQKGLTYEVPCHGRIGGVIIYYPLSLIKAEGC